MRRKPEEKVTFRSFSWPSTFLMLKVEKQVENLKSTDDCQSETRNEYIFFTILTFEKRKLSSHQPKKWPPTWPFLPSWCVWIIYFLYLRYLFSQEISRWIQIHAYLYSFIASNWPKLQKTTEKVDFSHLFLLPNFYKIHVWEHFQTI